MPSNDDPNKPMDVREYRQYSESRHGKNALNDSMLKTLDRATGGKKVTRAQMDEIHGKIKVRQSGEQQ
jgi:hypothetical protein